MNRSHTFSLLLSCALAATLATTLVACVGQADDSEPNDDNVLVPGFEIISDDDAPPTTASGEDNTFDHPEPTDVWELLERMQAQGPAAYAARVHSCPKIRYRAIGTLLASRGVDLRTTGETQAGAMYTNGDQALGAANYGARARENLELTTASASKLFDIFVQAAPEIIATMSSRPACTVGGVGAEIFNQYDQCVPDGITCLIGVPATVGHLELCNQIISRASTPEKGKHIAVAALMAAAHTCE